MPALKKCKLPNNQDVYYRSKADVDILMREMFKDPVYLRHGLSIKDGDCIFDVGANIGFFLLQLSQQLKSGSVYSFEPVPEIFEVLRHNAELHCGLDYRLFNCGLSQQNGTTTFTYFPRTSVASTMYPDNSPEFKRNSRRFVLAEMRERNSLLRTAVDVTPEWVWFPITETIRRHFQATQEVTCQLRRLSDVIDEEKIERIDLLKVDVEGAEEDVLLGIDPRHWSLIRQAVVEIHQGREGLQRIERILNERGFTTAHEQVLPGVDHLYMLFATS